MYAIRSYYGRQLERRLLQERRQDAVDVHRHAERFEPGIERELIEIAVELADRNQPSVARMIGA